MRERLVPELTLLPESATADITGVRLFGLVEDAVRGEDALLREGLPANLALVRPLARVLPPERDSAMKISSPSNSCCFFSD